MDSDAGSYGAYGGLGAVYDHAQQDRTMYPAGDGRPSLQAAGGSERSMADDLRTAISGINLRASPMPSPRLDGGGGGRGDATPSAGGSPTSQRSSGVWEEKTGASTEPAEPLAFDPSDLEELRYLGEGAGGAVSMVRSRKTGKVMAKKVCL